MKFLRTLFRQDRERFVVPRSSQDVIPVKSIWEDGIFLVRCDKYIKYSKTFRFEDINYSVASKEDKESMFLEYSELLNSFDSGATYKISIVVKRVDKEQFKKDILIPLRGDANDVYINEINQHMLDEITGSNGFIQLKYITVSVCKNNIAEARSFFARVSTDMSAHLNRLGSNGVSMKDIQEWLGHSDFGTTANTYAHLMVDSKQDSANAMRSSGISLGATA